MSRSTPEWIGKTSDTAIPDRVRLRIFERHGGICHLSRRKIKSGEPWDLDHIVALVNGGAHRESNLAPALRDKHREKTAADVAEKAMVYRKRAKHLGVKKPRTIRSWRRFDGTIVHADRER
jgi:5-methylcytosine-specific restriction protein A